MLFEFLSHIDWLIWLEKLFFALGLVIFLVMVIWAGPGLLDLIMYWVSIHPKIRQGTLVFLRFFLAMASIFLVADVFGFNSATVVGVLTAVFGVGIYWAVRDNVANVLSVWFCHIVTVFGLDNYQYFLGFHVVHLAGLWNWRLYQFDIWWIQWYVHRFLTFQYECL